MASLFARPPVNQMLGIFYSQRIGKPVVVQTGMP